MRAEREAVDAHNQIISDEHQALYDAWSAEYEQACLNFIASEFGVDATEQKRIFDLRYQDQLHCGIEKHPIDEPEET